MLPRVIRYGRILKGAAACYKVRPHVIRCDRILQHAVACYNVRPHVRYYNMRLHLTTCGRTLEHAASCCKMRPHVITLTEGPIQPRYFLALFSKSFRNHCLALLLIFRGVQKVQYGPVMLWEFMLLLSTKQANNCTQKKSGKEETRFLQCKYITPATVFTNICSQGKKNYR